LLEHQSQFGEDSLSDVEIVDEFMTFFLAGTGTTATSVAFAVYNLLQNPTCLEKLNEEVSSIYATKSVNQINVDLLNTMTYLGLVLKENLRHSPPAPGVIPKEAINDHYLGTIPILKGTMVQTMTIATNYNAKYFEDPDEFRPERWSDNSSQTMKSCQDPFVFVPFGAGARACPGLQVAQIESKIILAEFLSHFKAKVSEGYKHRIIYRTTCDPFDPILVDLELLQKA